MPILSLKYLSIKIWKSYLTEIETLVFRFCQEECEFEARIEITSRIYAKVLWEVWFGSVHSWTGRWSGLRPACSRTVFWAFNIFSLSLTLYGLWSVTILPSCLHSGWYKNVHLRASGDDESGRKWIVRCWNFWRLMLLLLLLRGFIGFCCSKGPVTQGCWNMLLIKAWLN